MNQRLWTATDPLDSLAGLLDLPRAAALRALGRPLRLLLVDRRARAAAVGAGLCAVALLTSTLLPLWMLALVPFVWGVPHLLADVRYLVVRQGLHREAAALAIGLGSLGLTLGLDLGVRATLVACVLLSVVAAARAGAQRSWLRLGVFGSAWLVLAGLAWYAGTVADLFLAHLHNVVALGFWLVWRRQRDWSFALPTGLFLVGAGWIAWGGADRWLGMSTPVASLDMRTLADQLAPLQDPLAAQRLVQLYAFAQAMHYVVWIHLVPTEDRARPAPRSFRSSLRALRDDLSAPAVALAAGVAAVLLLLACRDLADARVRYFQIAQFHGHLELLAAAWLLQRGLRRADGAA